ncbi:MAG: pentapeptide repeat-containing protein [Angelakisella sp.]|nr:pentapeptide repeat-containing protein [Angelakisella sp.]
MQKLHAPTKLAQYHENLQSNCSACTGLCCTLLYFAKDDGFPYDKPAGEPCRNLAPNWQCMIHDDLRQKGCRGCTSYECLGAGQRTVAMCQQAEKKQDVVDDISLAQVFERLRCLHLMWWYLEEVSCLLPAQSLWHQAEDLLQKTKEMTQSDVDTLLKLDITEHQMEVNKILHNCWESVQSLCEKRGAKKRWDYVEKCLKGKNLCGHDFAMSLLIAADFSECSFYGANLLGADLRDCNLKGSDLSECVFLIQPQINAARGDKNTLLPARLKRPGHWR